MLDISLHRSYLIRILKDIFSNSKVGPYLGFKGGTTLLLFYNLPRFSVDLDFDLLDPKKEEQVFDDVNKILSKYGNVKSQNKRYSLFFLLSYNNKAEGAQNIKVEINKRSFGSKYETKQYLGITMQVMTKEDMFANKLVAMYERIGRTNRDIFDVWFMLDNNWPINKDIIELRTSMKYENFLETLIKYLKDVPNRGILSGIGELLTPKQKNWVKENLKNETLFLLNLKLNS